MLKSVLPSQWLAMLREYRDYGTTTTKHPECSLRRLGTDGFADALDAAEWASFAGSEGRLEGDLLNPLAATAPRVKLSKAGRDFLCSTSQMLDVDCMDAWTAACCVVGLPERLADQTSGSFALADAMRIRDEYFNQRTALLHLLCEVFLCCWQDSPAAGACSHVAQCLLQRPKSLLQKLQAANCAPTPDFDASPLLECVGYSPHSASGVQGEVRVAWALQAVKEQALLLRGMHTMAYTHNHMDSAHWLELGSLLDAHSEFKPPAHLLELLQGSVDEGAVSAAVGERQHHALLALLTPLIAGFVNGNASASCYAFQDEGLPRVQQYMREHIIPVVESAPPSSAKRPATRYQGAAAVLYLAWLTLNMLEHGKRGVGGPRSGADALRGASKAQLEHVMHGESTHLALAHLHCLMQDLQDRHRVQPASASTQHWCRSVQGTAWGMCACQTASHLPKLFASSGLRLRPSASIPHACHDAEVWALAPALRALTPGAAVAEQDAGEKQAKAVLHADSSMQSVCVVIHDLMIGLTSALERLGCRQPPLVSGWWLAAAEGSLRGAPDRASAVMSGSSSVPGAHSAHMQLLAHACSEFPVHVLPSLRLLCASASTSSAEVHAFLRHQLHTFTAVVTQGSADLAFPNGIQEGCTVVLREPLLCEASGVLLPAGIAGTLVQQQACVGTAQELLSTCSPLHRQQSSDHSLPFTIKWHWRQPALPVLLHRLGWLAWHASSRASPASLGVEVVAEMVATCDLLHGLLTGPSSHGERLQQLHLVAADVVRARRFARTAAGDASGEEAYSTVKAAMLHSDPYHVDADAAIPDLAISDVIQWLMHALSTCIASFARAAQQQDDAMAAWGGQDKHLSDMSVNGPALLRTSSSFGGSSSVQHSVARSAAAAAGATAVHMQAAVADSHFAAWSFKLLLTSSDLLNVLGELAPAEFSDVLSEPLGASSPRWTVPGTRSHAGSSASSHPLPGQDAPLGVQLIQAAVGSLEGYAMPRADSGLALALAGLLSTAVRCIVHHSVRLTAERAFSLFDLDGDGDITLSEFAETLRAIGVAADPQVVQELVKQLDINGDGKVQYNEFIRLVSHELHVASGMDSEQFTGDRGGLSTQVALFVRQLVHRQPARLQLLGDLAFSATEALILVIQRVQDWREPLERWLVAGSVASVLHLLCSSSIDITAPSAANSAVKRSGVHTSEVVSLDRSLPLSDSLVDALLGSPAARGSLLASCSELALSGLQNCSTNTDDLRAVWNHSLLQSIVSPEHVDALHSYTSTMLSVLQCALSKCSSLEVVARTMTATVQATALSSAGSTSMVYLLDCLASYCTYHLTDPAVEPHASQLISRILDDAQSEGTQQALHSQLSFINVRVLTATDISVQAAAFFPRVDLAADREDSHPAGIQTAPLPRRKRQRLLAAAEADTITDALFGALDDDSSKPVAQAAWAASAPAGLPLWYTGSHLLKATQHQAPQAPVKTQHQQGSPATSLGRLLDKLAPQVASALFGQSCKDGPAPATAPLRTTDAPRVLRAAGLNFAAFALQHDLPIAGILLAPGAAGTLRSVARPSGLVEAAVTIAAAERLLDKQPVLLNASLSVMSNLALKAASRPWASSALHLVGGQDDFWSGMTYTATYGGSAAGIDADYSVPGLSALRISNKASAVLLCAQLVASFASGSNEAVAASRLLHAVSQDHTALQLISQCFNVDLAGSMQGAQGSALDAGVSLAPFRAELAAAPHFTSPEEHIESAVSTVDSIQSIAPWASKYGESFMFQLRLLQDVLQGPGANGSLTAVTAAGEASPDSYSSFELIKSASLAGSHSSLYDAAAALSRGVHACCLLSRTAGAHSAADFAQQCCEVIAQSPCQLQLELAPVVHLARCVLAIASSEFSSTSAGPPSSKWRAILEACAFASQRLMRLRPAAWSVAFPRTEPGNLSNIAHASATSSAIGQLAHSPHMQSSAAIRALSEACCILLRNSVPASEEVISAILQVQLDMVSNCQLLQGRPLPLLWASGEWVLVPECDTAAEYVIGAAGEEFAAACSTLAVLLAEHGGHPGILQKLTIQRTATHLMQCFTSACETVSMLHEWHAMWWRKQLQVAQPATTSGSADKLPAKPNAAFVQVRAGLIATADCAINALLAMSAVPGGGACLLASGTLRTLASVSLFQGMESVQHARLQSAPAPAPGQGVSTLAAVSGNSAEWWGVGYGLGPAVAPGLDEEGRACAAHALWQTTVQVFTTCISTFIRAKYQEMEHLAAKLSATGAGAPPPSAQPVLSRRLSAALSSTSVEPSHDDNHLHGRIAWHSVAKLSSLASERMAVAPALLEELASIPAVRRSMTADRVGAWVNGSSSYEPSQSQMLPPSAGCILDALCQDAIAFVDKHKGTFISAFTRLSGPTLQEVSTYAQLLTSLLHPDCVPTWLRMCNNHAAASHSGRHGAPFPAWEEILRLSGISLDTSQLLGGCVYPIAVLLAAVEECSRRLIVRGGQLDNWLPRQRAITVEASDREVHILQVGESTLAVPHRAGASAEARRVCIPRHVLLGCTEGLAHAGRKSGAVITLAIEPSVHTGSDVESMGISVSREDRLQVLQDLLAVCVAGTQHAQSPLSQLLAPPAPESDQSGRNSFQSMLWEEFCRKWRPWASANARGPRDAVSQAAVAAAVHVAAQRAGLQLVQAPRGSLFGFNSRCLFGALNGASDVLNAEDSRAGVGHMLLLLSHCMQTHHTNKPDAMILRTIAGQALSLLVSAVDAARDNSKAESYVALQRAISCIVGDSGMTHDTLGHLCQAGLAGGVEAGGSAAELLQLPLPAVSAGRLLSNSSAQGKPISTEEAGLAVAWRQATRALCRVVGDGVFVQSTVRYMSELLTWRSAGDGQDMEIIIQQAC